MDRRTFLSACAATIAASSLHGVAESASPEIAITMDDPKPDTIGGMSGAEINRRILDALKRERLKACLFVCGKRIDNPEGKALLEAWDSAGHLIGNHSYSHQFYNSDKITIGEFTGDFLKNERLLLRYRHFTRLFRYPFLKEGNTVEKRDGFRTVLHKNGYRVGHVTVDASDWYVDTRMCARLEKDAKADTRPYRDYYVDHIRERARYYRQLAREVLGREIRHTVLIHHSALNALYLSDLLAALKQDGWKLVDAADAFRDPVFRREPKTIPAGESLVWALAKESGRYEDRLRYPGEDDIYEKPKMDALGL